MSAYKSRIVLIWLPVILLPAGNLLAAAIAAPVFQAHIFLFSLLGAVAEEIFFRWVLLKKILMPHFKPFLSILLSALLFAAMHLLNLFNAMPLPSVILQVFCAFCFSIWAGTVVWQKNSIFIPLLAHILLNFTAVTEEMILPLIVSVFVLADGIILIKLRKI